LIGIDQNAAFWHSEIGNPKLMYRVRKPDLLDALKACLRELENRQLLHPDNLAIIDRKRIILEQIAVLERGNPDGQVTAARDP
jgi:hypothetical protein